MAVRLSQPMGMVPLLASLGVIRVVLAVVVSILVPLLPTLVAPRKFRTAKIEGFDQSLQNLTDLARRPRGAV